MAYTQCIVASLSNQVEKLPARIPQMNYLAIREALTDDDHDTRAMAREALLKIGHEPQLERHSSGAGAGCGKDVPGLARERLEACPPHPQSSR
jgi:hypothetical protein